MTMKYTTLGPGINTAIRIDEESKYDLARKATTILIRSKVCKDCLVLASCKIGCPCTIKIHSAMMSWLISRPHEEWSGAIDRFKELMTEFCQ